MHLYSCRPLQAQVVIVAEDIPLRRHHHHHLETTYGDDVIHSRMCQPQDKPTGHAKPPPSAVLMQNGTERSSFMLLSFLSISSSCNSWSFAVSPVCGGRAQALCALDPSNRPPRQQRGAVKELRLAPPAPRTPLLAVQPLQSPRLHVQAS